MAKRARGSVRPGQRRPTTRRPASSAAAPAAGTTAAPATAKPSGLSDAELERAAELEAQLLAEEKAAEQSRKRSRDRGTTRDVVGTGTIAMQAEQEYAYVGRDLRRIAKVAVLEFVILIVLFILIDVTKVVSIGG
jgi:hypothetical protein